MADMYTSLKHTQEPPLMEIVWFSLWLLNIFFFVFFLTVKLHQLRKPTQVALDLILFVRVCILACCLLATLALDIYFPYSSFAEIKHESEQPNVPNVARLELLRSKKGSRRKGTTFLNNICPGGIQFVVR